MSTPSRRVGCELVFTVPSRVVIALQIAPATDLADEKLDATLDGRPLLHAPREFGGADGGRVPAPLGRRLRPRAVLHGLPCRRRGAPGTGLEVLDPTRLTSRPSLVRIVTGRDAADTAFQTTLAGAADLISVEVTATVDGSAPDRRPHGAIGLGLTGDGNLSDPVRSVPAMTTWARQP